MVGGGRVPDGIPARYGPYALDGMALRDLRQVVRLEAEVFPEPLSLAALTRLWLLSSTSYLVVRQERQVAGYIGFQICAAAAHTISMAVHPAFRRQGLATLLQRTADQVAKGRGARWFTGEVRISNDAQLRFLEGMGWQRIGVCRRFFGNGEDAVVVWHWLDG